MHGYEALRQRHVADAMALAPQLIQRLDWSAGRLAEHRHASLRAIVAHAVAQSPWHRERLAGVDLTRLDEDSLRELPPMTKRDLMDNFDRIVTDPRVTLERVNAHISRPRRRTVTCSSATRRSRRAGRAVSAACSCTTGKVGRPSG